MNAQLPFLQELLEETLDNNEPSFVEDYDFSGYYTLNNNHSYQMVFCLRCGEYCMSNTLDMSFINTCECQLIYPHSMIEQTRSIYIKNCYKQMQIVLLELYNKFIKKNKMDMLKITNFIIEYKTQKEINWN